jgi:hypothetical protein
MSPKVSRPADEPDEPEERAIPPGHVPLTPSVKRELKRPEPISVWWKLGGLVVVLSAATVGTIVYLSQPPDPRSSARGTAELVAESLSSADLHAFESYLCYSEDTDRPNILLYAEFTAQRAGKMTVLDVSEEYRGGAQSHSVASATLTSSRHLDTDTVLLMDNSEDSWCLVSMYDCSIVDDSTSSQLAPGPSGCRNRPGRSR